MEKNKLNEIEKLKKENEKLAKELHLKEDKAIKPKKEKEEIKEDIIEPITENKEVNPKNSKKIIIIGIVVIALLAIAIYVVITIIESNKPINEKLSKHGYKLIYSDYINYTDENGTCYDHDDKSKIIKCERLYNEVEYQGKTTSVKNIPQVFIIDNEYNHVAAYNDETFSKASDNEMFTHSDEERYKKLLSKTHTSEEELKKYLENELNKVYKTNRDIEYFNDYPKVIYNTFMEDMSKNGWSLASKSDSFIRFEKGDSNLAVSISGDRVEYIVYDKDNQRQSIFDRLSYVSGIIMKPNYIDIDCTEILDSGKSGYYYEDSSTCDGRLDSLYQEYLNFYKTVLTEREFSWLYGYIYYH